MSTRSAGPSFLRHLDGLDDFQRVAGAAAERLVHVRDQRGHALAHARGRRATMVCGQLAGVVDASS